MKTLIKYAIFCILCIVVSGCNTFNEMFYHVSNQVYSEFYSKHSAKMELINSIINNPDSLNVVVTQSCLYNESVISNEYKNLSVEEKKQIKHIIENNPKFYFDGKYVYNYIYEDRTFEHIYFYSSSINERYLAVRFVLKGGRWYFSTIVVLGEEQIETYKH